MKKILLWLMLLVATNGYAQQIDYAEYYIDNAVAVGDGTPISISSPFDSTDLTVNISTTGIEPGSHILYLRVRYTTGLWSLFEGRAFYVNPTSLNTSAKISGAEYYFDSDNSGVGTRTVLITGSLADSINITSNISISGLSSGSHNLMLRTQDSAGVWGLFEARPFYVTEVVQPSFGSKLMAAEYFYNTEPGLGNGIAVSPSFTLSDSINLSRTTSTTGLHTGFDTLFIRVKDSSGNWSFPLSQVFSINSDSPDTNSQNSGLNRINSITTSANPLCVGSFTTLTSIGSSGQIYWYSESCGVTQIGTGNTLHVSPSAITTYYARSFLNGQFSPNCASITITPCNCSH